MELAMDEKGLGTAITVLENWISQVLNAIINTFTLPFRVLDALLD